MLLAFYYAKTYRFGSLRLRVQFYTDMLDECRALNPSDIAQM